MRKTAAGGEDVNGRWSCSPFVLGSCLCRTCFLLVSSRVSSHICFLRCRIPRLNPTLGGQTSNGRRLRWRGRTGDPVAASQRCCWPPRWRASPPARRWRRRLRTRPTAHSEIRLREVERSRIDRRLALPERIAVSTEPRTRPPSTPVRSSPTTRRWPGRSRRCRSWPTAGAASARAPRTRRRPAASRARPRASGFVVKSLAKTWTRTPGISWLWY